MERRVDGWHELEVSGVAPGLAYQFALEDGTLVPDPAAKGQQHDVHGASLLVDPSRYVWRIPEWRPRSWEASVYYELHLGTFTPEGTFAAARDRLTHLADLGITTIELMPVGQFAGTRGWGYDGVLIYAPHNSYGSPDDMRAFIDAAHGLGLNVVLDVIYNHFGPEGNYLSLYAPQFFHPERATPWGSAIAYERLPVRQFFIENAIYWLDAFHLDGLRLDAIDHIRDDTSETEIIVEIAQAIRAQYPDRAIHLTTEDNRNITSLHERGPAGEITLYSGEWNDDLHNVAHVIATGETEGYYNDFAMRRWWKLARALTEGFAFQGETQATGTKAPRGEPSAHLPPTAFVDFIQNHDQIGNRAFGERLTDLAEASMVETLMAMELLSPHIPLLFMGEEWGETRSFCFFTDFHGALADTVREGRRREFAGFGAFHDEASSLAQVPDPNALSTFEASKLDWGGLNTKEGRARLALARRLLRLRAEFIVPHLAGTGGNAGKIGTFEDGMIVVSWQLDGARLHMRLNLDDEPRSSYPTAGRCLYSTLDPAAQANGQESVMPAHTIVVTLEDDDQRQENLS